MPPVVAACLRKPRHAGSKAVVAGQRPAPRIPTKWLMRSTRSKEAVELRERRRALEAGEAALLSHRSGGADEAAPRGAREGRAHTHAAYAHLRQVGDPQPRIRAHQDVNRPGADRCYDGL